MCGIFGVMGPPTDAREAVMRAMSTAIAHRGPDSEGMHDRPEIAIGMRRLSIIDIAGGAQPVFNETGSIAAVFNGEIYNFKELRSHLLSRGHTLKSHSDSEVIPHLYEEYGDGFVSRLRGMFAIALWDAGSNRLLLARDRLGKKPLYYRADQNGIAFASELKALLVDAATDRTIDEVAISHYLTYQYVPAPFSAIRSVRKVEPATVITYEHGRIRSHRYWRLEYRPEGAPENRSRRELADELRERIMDCVRVRLVSERPIGAFLSGGLDSSAIVAAMSRVSDQRVKTFSIGFDEASHNELPFARQVAERYGTEHHELIVRPDAASILPLLARSFDEPYADSSAIPSYYLAEMTRQQVVVALNGDGGDETFGGYLRYPRYLQSLTRGMSSPARARLIGYLGKSLRPLATRSQFARRASTAAYLMADAAPARRYARFLSYFQPEQKAALLTGDFARTVSEHDSYRFVEEVWDEHQHTDGLNRLLAVDTYTYLPGDLLSKVDITTMAVSLEARSPLLDHTLMEWAAGISGTMKVAGDTTKDLLKEALSPWLPDSLIHREKMGFGVPLADWLRGPLKDIAYDLLTDQTARGRGWFDPAAVNLLLSEHMAGHNRSPQIYALVMLEIWRREVLEVGSIIRA